MGLLRSMRIPLFMRINRSMGVLLTGILVFHAGWYMLLPYFAVLFTSRRGLSPAQVGLVLAVQSISLLLGSLAGGVISDRTGYKPTILGGLVVRAAGLGLLGLTTTLPSLVGAALVSGFGGGLYGPSAKAAIATLADPENRAEAFSLRGVAANMGTSTGPLLGTLLVWGSMAVLFGAAAVLHLLLGLFTWAALRGREAAPQGRPEAVPQVRREAAPQGRPEAVPQVRREAAPQVRPEAAPQGRPEAVPRGGREAVPQGRPEAVPQVRREAVPQGRREAAPQVRRNLAGRPDRPAAGWQIVLADRPYLLFSLVTVLAWALFTQLALAMPLYARQTLGLEAAIGLLWTVSSVAVILLQVPVTRTLLARMQPMAAMALGAVLLGGGLASIGLAHSFAGLLGAVLLFVVGEMFLLPTADSTVSLLANPAAVGTYFGVSSFTWGLGEGLGNLIGGGLMQVALQGGRPGLPWPLYGATGLVLAGLYWALGRSPVVAHRLRQAPAVAAALVTAPAGTAAAPPTTQARGPEKKAAAAVYRPEAPAPPPSDVVELGPPEGEA